jgi:hypothetical protein
LVSFEEINSFYLNKKEKLDLQVMTENKWNFTLKKLKNVFTDKSINENLDNLEKFSQTETSEQSDFIEKTIKHYIPFESHMNNETRHLSILGDDVLSDLEIFQDYQNNCPFYTLLHMISSSKEWSQANICLEGSKNCLTTILNNPLCDTDALQKRQDTLKRIQLACQTKDLSFSWKVVKENEKTLCWFLDAKEDISKNLHDMVYMNIWLLKSLNNSSTFLTGYNIYRMMLSPLIGIFTPIAYVIIPFIVLRYKYNIPMTFLMYLKMSIKLFLSSSIKLTSSLESIRKISIGLTIVFYFQGLFNSVELGKTTYKITKVIVTKMNGLLNFTHHCKILIDHLFLNTDARIFGIDLPTDIKSIDNVCDTIITQNKNIFFNQDQTNTSPLSENVIGGVDGSQFSIFSSFGKQLMCYKHLNLRALKTLYQKLYILDTLVSIGNLTKSQDGRHMCWSTFIKDEENTKKIPLLQIKRCYHPCLPGIPFDKIVKNDIDLGGKGEDIGKNRNMLLTGPNAGGKSTIIKSMLLSVLLSQTLTVSNCIDIKIRPFKFINSQINIPDCKGKQSLFEAEMYRSKKIFDILDSLHENDTSLIAMDEIFSSTNPIEGMAGAYAIAKRLSQNTKAINIISTHYGYLSKLQKDGGLFTNYKMNVNMDENDNVHSYPYKLCKGVSRQYIALELLRKNGFNPDLIEEAVKIKNSFLKK